METSLPKRNNRATHWQVREQGHELLRRNVVEAASRLLEEEGPDALTVRRIAQELECSTKIIYTMFHGKDGLADALYMEGCKRLSQSVSNVQRGAIATQYVYEVAGAYWSFALANPSYYKVMFCGAIPNFQPSTQSIATTEAAFEMVVASMQQYMEEGMLPFAGNAARATKAIWASLHGVVSLYLLGHFSNLEEAKDAFERTIEALVASLVSDTQVART